MPFRTPAILVRRLPPVTGGSPNASVSRAPDVDRSNVSHTGSLARNTVWMAIALLSQAAGLGLTVFLLGWLAGPEAIGTYSFAMALVVPVLTTCNLGLRSQLLSDIDRSVGYAGYRFVRDCGNLSGALIIVLVVFIWRMPSEIAWAVVLLTIARIAEFYADLSCGYWQREEKHYLIALSIIIRTLMSLVGMLAALLWTGTTIAGLAGIAAGSVLSYITFDLPVVRRHMSRSDRTVRYPALHDVRTVLWNGLPLATSAFVNGANTSVPRLVLASVVGLTALGKLAVYFYAIQVVLVAVQALGHAFGPRMAKYYAAKDRASFRHLWAIAVLMVVAGTMALTMAMHFWGDAVIALTFGPQFLLDPGFAGALALGCIPMLVAGLLGFFLTSVRAFWVQLPLQAVVFATTCAMSAWLLPRMGISGVPWVWAASGLVAALGMMAAIDFRVRKLLQARADVS